MKITRRLTFLLCAADVSISRSPLHAETVTVFAAASLTDSLKVAASTLRSADRMTKSSSTFAASSLLARQIEEGAPADIFFSADAQVDG